MQLEKIILLIAILLLTPIASWSQTLSDKEFDALDSLDKVEAIYNQFMIGGTTIEEHNYNLIKAYADYRDCVSTNNPYIITSVWTLSAGIALLGGGLIIRACEPPGTGKVMTDSGLIVTGVGAAMLSFSIPYVNCKRKEAKRRFDREVLYQKVYDKQVRPIISIGSTPGGLGVFYNF